MLSASAIESEASTNSFGPQAYHVVCAGSRTKGLLMAYKLLDMAQARWRRLDGAHLLPLVRAGIGFVDGVQHEGKASKPKAKAA